MGTLQTYNTDSDESVQESKLSKIYQATANGTRFQPFIALIARYTTLTVIAIIGNIMYYLTMGLWIFAWQYSNIMGLIVFGVRSVSNLITVTVQYLLWYKYTKNVYHVLCHMFNGVCLKYCSMA